MNLLIITLLISIPLGQLTKVSPIPGVNFYLQDAVALVIAIALITKIKKRKKFPQTKLTKPIILFTAALCFSLLLNFNRVETNQAVVGFLYLLRWVIYTSIYFFTFSFKQENKALFKNISIRNGLLIAGISFSLFGILQYLLIPDVRQLKWLGWDDHYYRLVGTLLDPGFTGLILVLTAILAIGTKLKPGLKIIALATPIIALLLTYSRASYLAFLGAIIAFTAFSKRLRTGLLIAILFLLTLLVLPSAESEGTNLRRIYSLSQRVKTWNQAIEISKDHPVFGIGFNLLRYEQKKRGFLSDDWATSHSAAGIQNSYAFILATSGIVGFFSFIWLIRSMFKAHIKGFDAIDKGSQIVNASLVAVSIHAIFTNSWFYSWVLIWMWVLLGVTEAD